MNAQFLYLLDSTVLEFDASVIHCLPMDEGSSAVILDRSYFYPTGGGQAHDTGWIADAAVLDVVRDSSGERLIHVVDRPLMIGPVHAVIQADRRLRHRQHHTAQHLLTACFLRVTGLDTLSVHLNGYAPSTLDLPLTWLSASTLRQVEDLANDLIYQDLPVKTYFVSPAQVSQLPLRQQPKVSEDIRIVEIDGLDYSPCGGTHCSSTGNIGLIKLWKTEHPNREILRVPFSAGRQAFDALRDEHESLSALAARFGASLREVGQLVERQASQLSETQDRLEKLEAEQLQVEAVRIANQAEPIGPHQVVLAGFVNRPIAHLRALAAGLRSAGNVLAVLSSYDGQKLTVIVVCPASSALSARDLLTQLLAPVGGRGGGDAVLAQGGGLASDDQAAAFTGWVRDFLRQSS